MNIFPGLYGWINRAVWIYWQGRMSMVFRALMMTNNIVLLADLTMMITFTYVTFCHQQQYSERTYLFCHQRRYSERTYDNTCFLPLNGNIPSNCWWRSNSNNSAPSIRYRYSRAWTLLVIKTVCWRVYDFWFALEFTWSHQHHMATDCHMYLIYLYFGNRNNIAWVITCNGMPSDHCKHVFKKMLINSFFQRIRSSWESNCWRRIIQFYWKKRIWKCISMLY